MQVDAADELELAAFWPLRLLLAQRPIRQGCDFGEGIRRGIVGKQSVRDGPAGNARGAKDEGVVARFVRTTHSEIM